MTDRDSGLADAPKRVDDYAAAWRIAVEDTRDTGTSILAFGRRDDRPVVLKVSKTPGDEWRGGEVLRAFAGSGTVRIYDRAPGAVLLERLSPGTPLSSVALNGNDDEAAKILAEVVATMAPSGVPAGTPAVDDWGAGFDRYTTAGDQQISADLVRTARRVYFALCDSQSLPRLLHGDLHHDNVLWDAGRGWLAVDPKGVAGELEYEVGAALRNPVERPSLYADAGRVQKRVDCFVVRLGLDRARVLAWAFSQAVLSAVWMIEDGSALDPGNGFIALARVMRPMVTEQFLS